MITSLFLLVCLACVPQVREFKNTQSACEALAGEKKATLWRVETWHICAVGSTGGITTLELNPTICFGDGCSYTIDQCHSSLTTSVSQVKCKKVKKEYYEIEEPEREETSFLGISDIVLETVIHSTQSYRQNED